MSLARTFFFLVNRFPKTLTFHFLKRIIKSNITKAKRIPHGQDFFNPKGKCRMTKPHRLKSKRLAQL